MPHDEEWLRARAAEANRNRQHRVDEQAHADSQSRADTHSSASSAGRQDRSRRGTASYEEFLRGTPHSAHFVYVLKTRYNSGIVKIGRTKNPPHERAKELNRQTGVANDQWQVAYAVGTFESHSLERMLHRMFAPHARGGEVFEVPLVNVVQAILTFSVISTFDLADVERVAQERAAEAQRAAAARAAEAARVAAERAAAEEAKRRERYAAEQRATLDRQRAEAAARSEANRKALARADAYFRVARAAGIGVCLGITLLVVFPYVTRTTAATPASDSPPQDVARLQKEATLDTELREVRREHPYATCELSQSDVQCTPRVVAWSEWKAAHPHSVEDEKRRFGYARPDGETVDVLSIGTIDGIAKQLKNRKIGSEASRRAAVKDLDEALSRTRDYVVAARQDHPQDYCWWVGALDDSGAIVCEPKESDPEPPARPFGRADTYSGDAPLQMSGTLDP